MSGENRAPNWRSIAREKLASLFCEDVSELDDVVPELAAHLEDLYEQSRNEGLSEPQALQSALSAVPDWHALARQIRRSGQKENEMNQRTKAVWIPGLVSLTAASGALAIVQVWGVGLHIVWMRSGLALLFYIPWLIALPAFGGVGAYISRRNGGSLSERLTAGLFPVAGMLPALCLAFCNAIAMIFIANRHTITLGGLAVCIAAWVVVPGVALAVGTLPFLGTARAQESH